MSEPAGITPESITSLASAWECVRHLLAINRAPDNAQKLVRDVFYFGASFCFGLLTLGIDRDDPDPVRTRQERILALHREIVCFREQPEQPERKDPL